MPVLFILIKYFCKMVCDMKTIPMPSDTTLKLYFIALFFIVLSYTCLLAVRRAIAQAALSYLVTYVAPPALHSHAPS
jgi:hypothetical protein